MATYGSIPGVQITTSTGTVAGVTIGRAQYLTLVGVGGPDADAEPNEVIRIDDRSDARETFGEDSDIAEAYERALANGANPDFINAVKAETTSETVTETDSSGTLANWPIVPDPERITVLDDGTELDVEFVYEDTITPEEEGVFYINPNTGDYDIDIDATEIEIDYTYADWDSAIEATMDALDEGQFGVITPLTTAPGPITTLEGVIEQMRGEMKMAVSLFAAEPNATDGYPWIDVGDYESGFSDDTLFAVGPTTLEEPDMNAGYGVGALGAVAGLFAGNDTTEPVYDNTVSGIAGLHQELTRADVADLRDEYTIPLRDTGTVRLKDNHSTYDQDTEGGWERDYFRRRIVDLTTVTTFLIARRQLGGILDDDTIDDVEDALFAELRELEGDGLLEAGEQDVNVYRKDDRTIGIDAQITPFGVAKGADVELEVIA